MRKGILFSRFLAIALLFLMNNAYAQDASIEFKIKAGYLYNFTKFITWPENDSPSFNICIVGKDPFGSIIDPIEQRFVKDKPIRLLRLKAVSESNHCQLIYFSKASQIKTISGVLSINSIAPALTVGETQQFVEQGGMIGFALSDNKIKLHINLSAIRQSGLQISAKLLEVSEVYEGGAND